MRVLVRVARAVVFHLRAQDIRQPRVVQIVRLHHDRIGIRLFAAQEGVDRVGLEPRVPAEPDFRAVLAQRRAQQFQAHGAQGLRLFHPGSVKPLERLDAVGRVVLHALEDDDAAAWRVDLVLLDVELLRHAHRGDLVLQQPLDRLLKALLHLADARPTSPGVHQAALDQQLSEEMGLPRASTAVHAFVAGSLQQRDIRPRGLNLEVHCFGSTMTR